MREGRQDSNAKTLRVRASLPRMFGIGALVLLVVTAGVVIFSAYRSSGNAEFRMQGFPASLSKDVVATVTGYERREMDGDVTKYYIRADKATSFADNHQELENVTLEVFAEDGAGSDKISALKAVYIPGENKNFTAYFAGSVNVETRNALKVKAEQLSYQRETDTATAEETVDFERENVKGTSRGAIVRITQKLLELQTDVRIEALGESEPGKPNGEKAVLLSGNARYDFGGSKIDLERNVSLSVTSPASDGRVERSGTLLAGRAVAIIGTADSEGASAKYPLRSVELFDDVRITTAEGAKPPTRISAGYAKYESEADRYELKTGVKILAAETETPTEIGGDLAVYQRLAAKVDLKGNATIFQGASSVRGDSAYAEMAPSDRIKLAEIRGSAAVIQSTPERQTEVTGAAIRADFANDSSLTRARVSGGGNVTLAPLNAAEYTRLSMAAASSIDVAFKGDGLLEKIETIGRTKVKMEVPNNGPAAANRILEANSVTTAFWPNGRDVATAVAVGNAQLVVTPLNPADDSYTSTVTAPRFDCEFFAAGSDPKRCTASTKARLTRVPSRPAADRGTQEMQSEKLYVSFDDASRQLTSFEASGAATFSELDRKASSETMIFTTSDEVLRMRGGKPSAWDKQARARAPEIDWDTRNQVSQLRGGASTTYYGDSKAGEATPFANGEGPVFVTAQNARFDHKGESAVYTGNARGWRDRNYVRADRLTIFEAEGRLLAESNVQSLLQQATRRENGVSTNQPVFVTAGRMTYARETRLVRYETDVDIRQGKDRVTGGTANIFLNESNSPTRTEVENNVVVNQPNRRAAADFVRYDALTETAYLRGNPAVVEDAVQGTSRGAEITINLKENRVASAGATRQNPSGRTRSVFKVRSQ